MKKASVGMATPEVDSTRSVGHWCQKSKVPVAHKTQNKELALRNNQFLSILIKSYFGKEKQTSDEQGETLSPDLAAAKI